MSALLRRLSTPRGAPTAPAAPAAAPAAAAPGHAPLVIPSQDDLALDPPVWDLVVVGAGVAGAAFAHAQAAAGRRVLLLERDLAQPDRIVGELLQPGGFLALKRLGLEACTEGIDAQRVAGYAMFKGGEEAVVAYPTEGFAGDVAGRSFHHGRFVQNLRAAAAAAPGVTVRAGTVRALLGAEGTQDWDEGRGSVSGVRYRHAATGEERAARAHLTVVCDGMYSGLRKKLAVEPLIKHPSHFVALLLEGAALPHPGYGHVVLADPSPVLFYPISSTEVRCLVDYPGGGALPAAEELKKYLLATVAPQVPPALRAPFEAAVAAGRVRSMQNKQLTAAPVHAPGALLLGDAFNMRHPLTGGGMTVALSDTRLLAEMLRPVPALADALRASDATAAFYVRRKPLAATINTLANALYDVFCAADSKTSYAGAAHEEMRQACFDYLRMGGAFSAGPVSLLSGLNPRPSLLVAHFFMVALYGVGRLLLPRPSVRGVFLGVGLLVTAARIILPIIWAEGPRAVFAPALAARAPRGRARAAAEGAAAAAAAATAAAAAAAG